MLNELVVIERSLRQAGEDVVRRHPAIKDVRQVQTLVVALAEDGNVEAVYPLPAEARAWTIRDGQHNSFPFVQPKHALWSIPAEHPAVTVLGDRRKPLMVRRRALLDLASVAAVNPIAAGELAGPGLLRRLHYRREQHPALAGHEHSRVLADSMARFLLANAPDRQTSAVLLVTRIAASLLLRLEESAQEAWFEVAAGLLVGKEKSGRRTAEAALLFDAAGSGLPIFHPLVAGAVSAVLSEHGGGEPAGSSECALTGALTRLVEGNFPQPNLPELGQTWLFAKNKEIPANRRYRRVGTSAFAVGESIVQDLQGALLAVLDPERRNVTWRPIPSEGQGRDLLIAYVEGAPEARVTELLTEDDLSMEEPGDAGIASIAVFRERTRRVLAAVEGRAMSDSEVHYMRLIIIRKVDPANRKVTHSGAPSVEDLRLSAEEWAEGEANAPPGITLPVRFRLQSGEKGQRSLSPPHVAPLMLVEFSKRLFIRGGVQRQDAVGRPAAEALQLFLCATGAIHHAVATSCARRWLRLILTRRSSLVVGTAHATHRRDNLLHSYDRLEALRTITVLGVCLHKLNRDRRVYMDGVAFKLGQLLAAVDVVHAGYCADIRGGSVPPSLLGNQVFSMAQTNPVAAIATLCRRWKPYDGWAKKTFRDTERIQGLVSSRNPKDQQRGWAIRTALRHARDVAPLARDLGASIADCRPDDIFRAELLLGYMGGLPRGDRRDAEDVPDTESSIAAAAGKREVQ